MRRSLIGLAAVGALLAPTASAQLALSPGYHLEDFTFASGGGGASSASFASFVALQVVEGGESTSPSFIATFGFLGAHNPEPTNAPVLFGVTPFVGPLEGATPITIAGLNFQKPGAGPIAATIGGTPVTGLAVVSDTILTAATPSGTAGAKNVVASSLFGSDTLAGGFTHTASLQLYGTGTPGCSGTQEVNADSLPKVGNTGFHLTCTNAPPNALGLGLVTNVQDVGGSDVFGIGVLLHVNLIFSTEVYTLDFVSGPTGFGVAAVPIPNVPILAGSIYFAQALWSWSSCSLPPLQLSTSKGLKMVIAP
jgi:IPT/TIG domain-containing protein